MEHWLATVAAMDPNRTAVVQDTGQLSYGELEQRARLVHRALSEHGVHPGDRVALALSSGADFVATLHGCWFAGAVPVPIDLRLSPLEQAARARGAAFVVDRPLAQSSSGPSPVGYELDSIGSGPSRVGYELESIAAVMHTSGTTAAPRQIELTYGNWLWSALASAAVLGLDRDERWLCPMPLVHVGGLSIPIRSAIYGTTAVLHERFETEAVLAALMDREQRITIVSLVPTMLARLLDAGLRAPPTLRWALLGGGPIANVLLEQAGGAGVPVAPTYGMTEACSQIVTRGWPLPGVELRLADDGEVLVRGPNVAPRAAASDGWLHTGDLGRLVERGRLEITGRKVDTIITGGENVAPTEVEAVLLEHPGVTDAAVFGRTDPDWGEAVVAAVVLRAGALADEQQLRRFCADRLAAHQVPKSVELVAELPRSPTGKLLRSQLRANV
jgi:O-succinylbenzoic acid--CoA ligase